MNKTEKKNNLKERINKKRLDIIADEYSLYFGDCIERMKEIKDKSIDLILTDPPYNIGNFMKERSTNLVKMRSNYFGSAGWDNMNSDDWIKMIDKFFEQAARVLKKGSSMIIFMAVIKVESIISVAYKYGFYYKTTGVWHKKNPMPRNKNLHFVNSTESWIYFIYKARTGIFNNNNELIHDFIESGLTSSKEKKYGSHPTQKPEFIMNHFVKLLTNKGDTVLDPFMGSGTTGSVSIAGGRYFIGIERKREYYNIAKKRLGDFND